MATHFLCVSSDIDSLIQTRPLVRKQRQNCRLLRTHRLLPLVIDGPLIHKESPYGTMKECI